MPRSRTHARTYAIRPPLRAARWDFDLVAFRPPLMPPRPTPRRLGFPATTFGGGGGGLISQMKRHAAGTSVSTPRTRTRGGSRPAPHVISRICTKHARLFEYCGPTERCRRDYDSYNARVCMISCFTRVCAYLSTHSMSR